MTFKAITYLFLLLFIIPFAAAKTDYNESGHADVFYQAGTGIFNSELTTDTIVPKVLTDGKLLSLVADLDNDTVNEIIVFDDSDVVLYQSSSLTQLFRLSLGISGRISNAIVFDVDDNDFPDIIFAEEETELLHFLEYNGTTFTNVSSLDLSGIEHGDGQIIVKCGAVGNCMMAVSTNTTNAPGGQVSKIFAHGFNKTTINSGLLIDTSLIGADNFCFSNIRHMQYVDYDSDGVTEYIFNAIEPNGGAASFYGIYFVSINDSLNATKEQQIEVTTDTSFIGVSNPNCEIDNIGRYFSSPLVFDINAPSSTPEIMMALTLGLSGGNTQFVLHGWKSDGSFLDSYPALCRPLFAWQNCPKADFVSNLVKVDIFEGTEGVDDVCVVGYGDNAIDIICGSETSTQSGFETLEILMNTPFNITTSYQSQRGIVHTGDYVEAFTANDDGSLKDIPEFLTSFGVLQISRTGLTSTASIVFANPQDNTVLIPVDAEKIGSEDFLLLKSSNFFYLDDGLSNKAAIITEIEFNPCPINSVLKTNTSMNIFVTVTDQNNALLGQDTVSSSVLMYQGNANEFNNSISDVVSGALQPYSIVLNKSVTGGNIRIEGWDSVNTANRDRKDISFTVAPNGIEFGDSECSLAFVAEEEEEIIVDEATLTEDADDNAITNALGTFEGLTGLAGTTVWLIFMILGAFFIYSIMAERGLSGSSALGTIAIVEVLAIILGARLGIFSTGLVVTIVVIGVVIIGIFLGRMFKGDSTAE